MSNTWPTGCNWPSNNFSVACQTFGIFPMFGYFLIDAENTLHCKHCSLAKLVNVLKYKISTTIP